MFKINTRQYCDSYLHFTDTLILNEACKKSILLKWDIEKTKRHGFFTDVTVALFLWANTMQIIALAGGFCTIRYPVFLTRCWKSQPSNPQPYSICTATRILYQLSSEILQLTTPTASRRNLPFSIYRSVLFNRITFKFL